MHKWFDAQFDQKILDGLYFESFAQVLVTIFLNFNLKRFSCHYPLINYPEYCTFDLGNHIVDFVQPFEFLEILFTVTVKLIPECFSNKNMTIQSLLFGENKR